jgi:hypothetical protein
MNQGGETHTFTEVDEFGGGIVADLNERMHLSTVAPECRALEQDDFVAPGQGIPPALRPLPEERRSWAT